MSTVRKPITIPKPIALASADWHIREDQPPCRSDNFFETQWKKISWIAEQQKRLQVPLLIAGDIFHHWKPSPFLIAETIKAFREFCYSVVAIPGNHDLQNHDILETSGINVLAEAGVLRLLKDDVQKGLYYVPIIQDGIKYAMIGLTHKLLFPPDQSFLAEKTGGILVNVFAEDEIEFLPDVTIVGDNHSFFSYCGFGKTILNPGCITRQKINESKYTPCIYLIYDDFSCKQLVIPHEEHPFKDGYLEEEKEKDQRKEERENKYVSQLKDGKITIDVDFKENMKIHIQKNKISLEVSSMIHESMENKNE